MRLDSEMQHLRQFDTELFVLTGRKKELEGILESSVLEKQQLEGSIDATRKRLTQAEQRLSNLLSANSWIGDSFS